MFRSPLLFVFINLALNVSLEAQQKVQQGVLFKQGTTTRIAGALISNLKTRQQVSSNHFGIFRIVASPSDTLQIIADGFQPRLFVVSDYKDAILRLSTNFMLDEVLVRGTSVKKELEESREQYTKKGVFYKGRPRWYLAAFKPLTFINEMFGRNARHARHFESFAARESQYSEIANRFNTTAVKRVVAISEDELTVFMTDYWPTIEQIRRWNDYDLISYIKKSYADFKVRKSTNPGN